MVINGIKSSKVGYLVHISVSSVSLFIQLYFVNIYRKSEESKGTVNRNDSCIAKWLLDNYYSRYIISHKYFLFSFFR